MRTIWIVFRKELRDGLRDRRSLLAAFAFALLGPLVIGMALGALAERAEDDRPPTVHAVAAADSSAGEALVAFLESHEARVVRWIEGAEGEEREEALAAAVRAGEVPVGLVIGSDFATDLAAYEPASLTLLWNEARTASVRDRKRLLVLLKSWEGAVAEHRLLARGVAPRITEPLRLQQRDLSTPAGRGAPALAMLPVFLLMSAFVGGMNLAIDVTAGERERGSLESLLLFPVPRAALAAGKWLAAVSLNVLVVAATLATAVVVTRSPRLDVLGLGFGGDGRAVTAALLLLLPLALLGPAVEMVVALFSRSFKEAQTYLSLLVLLPALPGFVFAFREVTVEPWMRITPILGQQIALLDLLRGEVLRPGAQSLLAAVTVTASLACVALLARLLTRERLVLLQ